MAGTTSAGLGNGGTNYNDADAALKKQIAQNTLKLQSDPSYGQSEIARTLQVIQNRQSQGLDTSAQQKYLTQNLGYNTAASTPTITNQTNTPAAPTNSNMSQYTDLMNQMKEIANRQQTPFSYDANSDPAYQAALQRARANIDEGNSAAQAEMNRRNILNSTITSDRMGEISSKEMGNVESNVLPQLMQQAYQRYMNEENMKQQQFSNLGSLASMYQNEDQRGIDNNFAESDRTGNYLPIEAKSIVSNILQLKQQAEAKGITAAERAKLSAQADGYRAQLAAMNIDPSAYASSVSANSIISNPGIRTLAGQQVDLQRQNQTFNQGQQLSDNAFRDKQFEYQKSRDSVADNQWNNTFDYQKSRDQVSDAQWKAQQSLTQRVQLGQLSIQQANSLLDQATSLGYVTPQLAELTGIPAGTNFLNNQPQAAKKVTAEEYATSYLDKAAKYDEDGILQNKEAIKASILQSGLPDSEIAKLYLRYGIPLPAGYSGTTGN